MIQTLLNEIETDKQVQDSILCSYLWNGTTKDTLILMALPVFDTPTETELLRPDGV